MRKYWLIAFVVILGTTVAHVILDKSAPAIDRIPEPADSASEPADLVTDAADKSWTNADSSTDADVTIPDRTFEEGEVIREWGDFVGKRIVARNCRILTQRAMTEAGETYFDRQHCDLDTEYDHPYADLDDEALMMLAETDGAAALIAAERLASQMPPNSELVDRLFVHALALSGEEQAFYALYDHMTGGAGVIRTVEGALDIEHVADSFVWASIGERLGYNTGMEVSRYREALISEGIDVARLTPQVDHWADLITARRVQEVGEGF